MYSGCHGNKNQFKTLNECYELCGKFYIVVIFLYNDTISVIIIISLGCSFGQPTKKCSSDICDSSVCTNYPNAVCYLDKCANCSPRYFIENNEITNACGKFLLFIINFKQYIIWYTSIFLVYIYTLVPQVLTVFVLLLVAITL